MGRLDGRRSVAGHLGEKLFVCMHHITCSTRIFPVYWKGFRLTSKNHTMNILNLLFFRTDAGLLFSVHLQMFCRWPPTMPTSPLKWWMLWVVVRNAWMGSTGAGWDRVERIWHVPLKMKFNQDVYAGVCSCRCISGDAAFGNPCINYSLLRWSVSSTIHGVVRETCRSGCCLARKVHLSWVISWPERRPGVEEGHGLPTLPCILM